MKNILYLSICLLLFSCGEKTIKETQISTELSFSFDTVMVDSGEEFLHLNDNLFISDLSEDGRYLFNWNREANILEKIDLEELKLVKKISFEKEGPDGVGAFVFDYATTEDENALFWSSKKGIWDQKGKLLRALPIDQLLEGTEYMGEVMLSRLAPIPNEPDQFLTFYRSWRSNDYYFLIFDFSDDSFRKIELPELQKLSEFEITMMYEGQWMGSFNAGAVQSIQNDQVILALNSFNQAYIYDMKMDSLYFKTWEGPLVGSQQTAQLPKEVSAEGKERAEAMRKANEQINYGIFVWDKENRKYYRFSVKSIFSDEMTEFETYKVSGADVFLSVFDEDFKLIAESKIPEIQKRPAKHFVKDGKIWLFENIDDELAFVRITIN
ncbi:hypothetical protein Belba_1140 [Belliella baltica DSM 15883]|uniref:DUF4221 domain-containing protein n=1 Tax=Belliella baltica (strain DSM 15883 / CIP 108006 / LMG 21964 / BA134) TaxID=866536 RepID=I3Z3F8_BELBD|nr:DUF4221 family protein [Belliella baltica]AFL83776.1 hypothetical protein Belba_1140 [Belliella baltica DSM 15883]